MKFHTDKVLKLCELVILPFQKYSCCNILSFKKSTIISTLLCKTTLDQEQKRAKLQKSLRKTMCGGMDKCSNISFP